MTFKEALFGFALLALELVGAAALPVEQANVCGLSSYAAICPPSASATFQTPILGRTSHDVERVRILIKNLPTRKEAVEAVQKALGRHISAGSLSIFVIKHDISTPWRKPHQNPLRVQDLIQATRTRNEAVRVLRKKLGWPKTPENLSAYLANHNITVPWRVGPLIDGRRVSIARIQEILLTTRTRQDALSALQREVNWPKRANTLSVFISRHDLQVTWRRVKRDQLTRSSA